MVFHRSRSRWSGFADCSSPPPTTSQPHATPSVSIMPLTRAQHLLGNVGALASTAVRHTSTQEEPSLSTQAAPTPNKRQRRAQYALKANKQVTEEGPAEVKIVHGIPRSANFFGLIQELIARELPDADSGSSREDDALATILYMIIATCLLNQTRGRQAVPLFWRLISRWPTAEALRDADVRELTDFLQPIGLHRVRAQRLKDLGKKFSEDPPRAGVLYERRGTKNPPRAGLAPNVVEEPATCIGHLPGVGRYAIDSFRLFLVGGGAQRLLPSRQSTEGCRLHWILRKSGEQSSHPKIRLLPFPWPPATSQKKAQRIQTLLWLLVVMRQLYLATGAATSMGKVWKSTSGSVCSLWTKSCGHISNGVWAKDGIRWHPEKGPVAPFR
ncbi:hypothetical protein U1Q18_052102 [Sarracenia purpurea var. burkii]